MNLPVRLATLCVLALALQGCLEGPEPSTDVSYFCVELSLDSKKCDCLRSAMADFTADEMLLTTSNYRATKANWKKLKPEKPGLVMHREINWLGFGYTIRKKNPKYTDWARKITHVSKTVRQCKIRPRTFSVIRYIPTENERWYRQKRDEYFGWLVDFLE